MVGGFNRLRKEDLRRRILTYLHRAGYSTKNLSFNGALHLSKMQIRSYHFSQRTNKLIRERKFIASFKGEMLRHLAAGQDVIPSKIDPEITMVKPESEEASIFRFATLNWSIPTSNGYGRRIRFLVTDRNNHKLIGILALGDPVFNLNARDAWIGWDTATKTKNLINVMDAYVLGALPPYSNLIGGKLVASMVASNEVRKAFRTKYAKQKTIISKRLVNPQLVLCTTTSALGRSTLYDRFRVNGKLLFEKIGATKGYGHFHIPEKLFIEIRNYLAGVDDSYVNNNRFGQGPNWRFRVIRKGLTRLGLNPDMMCHGIKRDVYAIPLASNFRKFLKGEVKVPKMKGMPARDLAEFCKTRWMIPRSQRDTSYLAVSPESTLNMMLRSQP